MKSLKDKVAVITGAANGIGKALAIKLGKAGCKLALADIDHPNLDRTKNSIESQFCSTHVVDLGQRVQIQALVGRITELYGSVDILVNNAGVSIDAPLLEQTEDDIEWITNINYLGVVYCCKYFLPLLLERPEARIVNVSSAAGLQGFPQKTTYSASKSAITGFSESLRAELHGKNVGVSVIYPGPVKTFMLDRSRVHDDRRRQKIHNYLQEKGIAPEAVADAIITAILTNKPKVLVTRQAKATSLLKRIFASHFGEWIGRYQDKLPA